MDLILQFTEPSYMIRPACMSQVLSTAYPFKDTVQYTLVGAIHIASLNK